jgi:hypothetical protein
VAVDAVDGVVAYSVTPASMTRVTELPMDSGPDRNARLAPSATSSTA